MKENMWRLCQRSGASALAITAATQMLHSLVLLRETDDYSVLREETERIPRERHPHVPVSESDSRAF